MKILKILLAIVLVSYYSSSKAQLPLEPGDAVQTTNGMNAVAQGLLPPKRVVSVYKTSNTSSAVLGNSPSWTTVARYSYPNWVPDSLGMLFGLSIDQEPTPNIYVASTDIYNSSQIDRKIWRLDGNTGSHSLVYDFNNPTGSENQTSNKSFGNLKYVKIGGTHNIYVSDFESGTIHRLTGNPNSTNVWQIQTDYNPAFSNNVTTDDPTEVPYGLAIKKHGTTWRLYYAKIKNEIPYGSNEIYSVELGPNGDFLSSSSNNTERQEFLNAFDPQYTQPISDIDFSQDGSRMLISQQSWRYNAYYGRRGLGAHDSRIYEFIETIPSNWTLSPNEYGVGAFTGDNAAGGICYSNNNLIAEGNINQLEQYGCDSTIWASADALYLASDNYVYGIQGLPARGGDIYNSICIDSDGNFINSEKTKQGDVEVYNLPCKSNCGCGEWQSVNINGTFYDGNPPILPTISFDKNNPASGFILSNYACSSKDCEATYSYSLLNVATNQTLAFNTDNNRFDFSSFRKWDCGDYTFCIVPSCDGRACDTLCLDVKIVCNPCMECDGTAGIKQTKKEVKAVATDQGGNASMLSSKFEISSSIPVSQIRVMVDEIRVTSENKNCMVCKNAPITWGNILYGSLDGFSSSSGNNTVNKDQREIVFGAGTNLFDITNGANLKLNLGLPLTTGLECCETTAEICIKVTIRDINCCEREVMQCLSVTY